MSKQLESILKRAPRATAEAAQPAVRMDEVPSPAHATIAPIREAVTKSRDVSLGIEVPESVKRAVAIKAATEGVTNRTLLLRALQGIGIIIPDDQVGDRRK